MGAQAVRLMTYGDWVLFLDRHSTRLDEASVQALMEGRFEPNAAWKVFSLIRGCVERHVNHYAAKMRRAISVGGMVPDDVLFLAARFDSACRLASRLCNIDGLPQDAAFSLRDEIGRYAKSVLSEIADSLSRDGDDELRYPLNRLARKWCVG